MARFAVRSRVRRTRGTLQKARAREVGARMMTGRKFLSPARREVGAAMMTGRKFLSPPLLWLAPQSDHGSAACAETEAFFQYGPPESFFTLLARPTKSTSGSWRKDWMTGRKLLSPPLLWLAPQSDHGSAACAETDAFFQHGPLQPFFEFNSAGRPAKSTCAGRKFLSPPLLWLAPPSDRGSAARAR